MFNWEEGPEPDTDAWEEKIAEEYEEYLDAYCTTHGPDDCDYIDYAEFRSRRIIECDESEAEFHEDYA
jgi:hypothetical protein